MVPWMTDLVQILSSLSCLERSWWEWCDNYNFDYFIQHEHSSCFSSSCLVWVLIKEIHTDY